MIITEEILRRYPLITVTLSQAILVWTALTFTFKTCWYELTSSTHEKIIGMNCPHVHSTDTKGYGTDMRFLHPPYCKKRLLLLSRTTFTDITRHNSQLNPWCYLKCVSNESFDILPEYTYVKRLRTLSHSSIYKHLKEPLNQLVVQFTSTWKNPSLNWRLYTTNRVSCRKIIAQRGRVTLESISDCSIAYT